MPTVGHGPGMRSLFGALVVLGLAVGVLARPVSAERPPDLEVRPAARLSAALAPKRDVTKLKKVLERAQGCARDNMAEG